MCFVVQMYAFFFDIQIKPFEIKIVKAEKNTF